MADQRSNAPSYLSKDSYYEAEAEGNSRRLRQLHTPEMRSRPPTLGSDSNPPGEKTYNRVPKNKNLKRPFLLACGAPQTTGDSFRRLR